MSYRKVKQKLIKLYGEECFIDKLKLRPLEDKPKYYTSKRQMKKMKKLTYHHIKEKSKGGQTNVENGALLSVENHEWFNSQPEEVQKELNEQFQKYKSQACNVKYVDDLDLNFSIKAVELKTNERRGKYNRARQKQELRRIVNREIKYR